MNNQYYGSQKEDGRHKKDKLTDLEEPDVDPEMPDQTTKTTTINIAAGSHQFTTHDRGF
jgi:hypothetical protein